MLGLIFFIVFIFKIIIAIIYAIGNWLKKFKNLSIP
jgi:hypothetical protein